jgi:hypothetical protein
MTLSASQTVKNRVVGLQINNELKRMWKNAAVAYLLALYRNLSGVSEGNQGKPPSAWAVSRSRFETGPSQMRSKNISLWAENIGEANMEDGEFS